MFSYSSILLTISFFTCKGLNPGLVPTLKQKKYIDFLDSSKIDLIVATGPAGTGKTYFACRAALNKLKSDTIDNIIITRPLVTLEDEDIGFLPGTLNEKFAPFSQPIFDYFNDELSKNEIEKYVRQGNIETSPIGFLRGRTFENSFIIADEMQNCSPKQLLMLLTRIGVNSKIVVTGDISQCDLSPDKVPLNGLENLLDQISKCYPSYSDMIKERIALINFDMDDCKRSEFVKRIMNVYNT